MKFSNKFLDMDSSSYSYKCGIFDDSYQAEYFDEIGVMKYPINKYMMLEKNDLNFCNYD